MFKLQGADYRYVGEKSNFYWYEAFLVTLRIRPGDLLPKDTISYYCGDMSGLLVPNLKYHTIVEKQVIHLFQTICSNAGV